MVFSVLGVPKVHLVQSSYCAIGYNVVVATSCVVIRNRVNPKSPALPITSEVKMHSTSPAGMRTAVQASHAIIQRLRSESSMRA